MDKNSVSDHYSLENAIKFGWGSISGALVPERIAILEKYVEGLSILDAGCGGGAYVDYLCNKGFDATGVDKYEAFLSVASSANRKGKFLQGDITDLPFEDKSFDFTLSFDVLEHVDDVTAIRELARVTKKRILVSVPAANEVLPPYSLTTVPYCDQTHLRYYTSDMLRTLAQEIKPKKVEILPTHQIDFGRLINSMANEMDSSQNPFDGKVNPDWIGGKLAFFFWSRLASLKKIRLFYQLLYANINTYMPMYVDLIMIIDL